MNRVQAAAQTAAVMVLVMAAAWLVPPALQRARRLCPVRPNGIGPAEAIPTFARKYKTSCTTCHGPVPIKLNNFGEAFKNSAFRMPSDDEGMTKIEMQALGAEAWRENWARDIYPGVLPTELPISFQLYLDARYDPNDDKAGTRKARSVYWDMPHEFELITAGTLGRHMSFWANVEFKVKKPESLGGGATGIKETPVDFVQAYGQLDHLLDTSLLNVRFGRFEPRVVPFSRVSRRVIAQDLLSSEHKLVNGFNFATMQGGTELWGARSIAQTGGGLVYAVGLLNGDGDSNGDNNRTQDVYGRLSYKFGGMGVADSLASSKDLNVAGNWVDNSVRIGMYGYRGAATAAGLGYQVGGADVDVWYRNLNLYATAWTGMEDLAANTAKPHGNKGQKSTAFTLGGDYIVWPWLTGILRYEVADQGSDASKHIRRVIPAVVVGIRPNITWTTEAHIYNNYGKTTGPVKTGDEMVRTRLRFIF